MDHVVYVQVYLEDISHYQRAQRSFHDLLSHDPPARGVLGVARVPGSSVQMTAVVVRDIEGKQPVSYPDGPQTRPTPRHADI